MKDRREMLGSEKISRLLIKLSVPAMIGMFVMALYNIVDSIFVGRIVGPQGLGGIALVFPLQMIGMAIAQAVGIGGASIISRALGEKQLSHAEKTLDNLIVLIVSISILLSITGFIFMKPVLLLFGASDTLFPYASDYFGIIIFGLVFWFFAMASNNVVRAEGNAKAAMLSMLISAISNIILDFLFIVILEMGIKGAAIATVIAQVLAAFYLLAYFLSGKSIFHIKISNLTPDFAIIKEILSVGASAFARQTTGSITVIVINNSLNHYGGDISIAVFGVIFRLLSFAFMPMMGIVQGFMPIAGFNYGARKFQRISDALKMSIATTSMIGIIGFLIFMIFPEFLLKVFSSDSTFILHGVSAIRLVVFAFPLVGFQMITAGFYQALGKALPSLFLSIMRHAFFLIPLVLILPLFFQLNGIWQSFPISDILGIHCYHVLFYISPALITQRKAIYWELNENK